MTQNLLGLDHLAARQGGALFGDCRWRPVPSGSPGEPATLTLPWSLRLKLTCSWFAAPFFLDGNQPLSQRLQSIRTSSFPETVEKVGRLAHNTPNRWNDPVADRRGAQYKNIR